MLFSIICYLLFFFVAIPVMGWWSLIFVVYWTLKRTQIIHVISW